MLADLPWQDRQVRIQLKVRRFFCVTADCPKTTFAERLPEIAAVYARSTTRLHEALCLIGCALGGQAGARLATPLGMPTSPDTLLRRVKVSHRSLPVSVRVLGVDDWAWKKGQRYGTILCDLERRGVIDLLPGALHRLLLLLAEAPPGRCRTGLSTSDPVSGNFGQEP
jgi:transposase